MRQFIQRHQHRILGILSGFDRLRLRGTLRLLTNVGGLMSYLSLVGVLIKDFMAYAEGLTKRLRQTTEDNAQAAYGSFIRSNADCLASGTCGITVRKRRPIRTLL